MWNHKQITREAGFMHVFIGTSLNLFYYKYRSKMSGILYQKVQRRKFLSGAFNGNLCEDTQNDGSMKEKVKKQVEF